MCKWLVTLKIKCSECESFTKNVCLLKYEVYQYNHTTYCESWLHLDQNPLFFGQSENKNWFYFHEWSENKKNVKLLALVNINRRLLSV